MLQLQSGLGLVAFLTLAWALGPARRRPALRPLAWGLALLIGGAAVLRLPPVQAAMQLAVDGGVRALLAHTAHGTRFLFATFVPHQLAGADGTLRTIAGEVSPPLVNFAFAVLPTLVFFSALAAVMQHVGLLQALVRGASWLMLRTLGTSGAETVSTAANVLLGQTEAPVLVRPYVAAMTRSELLLVMVGGFSNTAGAALASYLSVAPEVPGMAGHLVASSLLSAPASILVAKLMLPEREVPATAGRLVFDDERPDANLFAAAARGATDGLKLAFNVAAVLIAFVAGVAMLDALLAWLPVGSCAGLPAIGPPEGCAPLSLSTLLSWLMAPAAWALGVPSGDTLRVAQLLGEKLVFTEIVPYVHLGEWQRSAAPLSDRAAILSAYALCGFANFASIGIQIGALSGMAPGRTAEIAALAPRAMIGGAIATALTACAVGLWIG